MPFGDYLRENIDLLKNASIKKTDPSSFWIILREIAIEDIMLIYPAKIDSYTAIPIYYEILSMNVDKFPKYFSQRLKSNNQERFRVINRNLFSSNSFHPDGLANQKEIKAYRIINDCKKGDCVIFQGVEEYANKKQ